MIETSTSVKNIDKKIFAIQTKCPVIIKKADNPYFKSKYAEYPEIQEEVKPLLFAEGILLNFMPITDGKLIMYVKDTDSAEFYKVGADLNMAGLTPQAQGSAITYLKRYMLTAFFDLQIEDGMDDDGNSGSNAQPKQQTQQQAAANTANAPALPWLNKDTKEWLTAKDYIFNKGKLIKDIQKKFKISKPNSEILTKTEPLKPGTKMWELVTIFLHDGGKPESVLSMFELSEDDMSDLLIDATNYTKLTEPIKQVTETK